MVGLSVDPMENHEQWATDIEETQGHRPNYPIIADGDFQVSKLYGMLPAETEGDPTSRTPADNQTVRNVATPAQWQQGDDVIIAGSVSDEDAKETYPDGWESPRRYIRIVPQPR